MTTAADIKGALHGRYNPSQNGREGEGFICIEEARSGAGFDGNNGACDFLAINTWQSRGMTIHGHEIKVSVSDWRKELAKPQKAERFQRFCHFWWLVIPDVIFPKIDTEIPAAWGVLTVTEKGRVMERHKPTRNRTPADVPVWWWIGWMAQVDRQHKRRLPELVRKQLEPERERLDRMMHDNEERRAAAQADHVLALQAKAAEIQRITGINLAIADRWTLERLGRAWRWAQCTGLDGLRNTLSAALRDLDEFLAEPEEATT